jgi:hypothetical protein
MMTIAYLDILVFYHLSLGPDLAGLLEVVTNVDCFCFLFSILGRNGEEGPPEGGRGGEREDWPVDNYVGTASLEMLAGILR